MSHRTLAAVAALAALAGNAQAQEAVATKTAPSFNARPYATVALRHHNIQNDGNTASTLQFRPTLGFKLLDGLLDASVLARFNKVNGESNVRQGAYTGTLMVRTITAGPVSIDPYLEHNVVRDQASNNKFAAYSSVGHAASTRLGMVALGAGLELGAYANNTAKTEKAPAEADRELARDHFDLVGLDESGKGEGRKTTPDYYHEWDASVGIKPVGADGLDITFRTIYNATYKERKVVADGRERSTFPLEGSTSQRLYLTYPLTAQLKVINETRWNQAGAWEKRAAAERVVNLARLEYTLFK